MKVGLVFSANFRIWDGSEDEEYIYIIFLKNVSFSVLFIYLLKEHFLFDFNNLNKLYF